MNNTQKPHRLFGTRGARIALIALVAIAVVLGLLASQFSRRGTAQTPSVQREWPSFTMQFIARQVDPSTGRTIIDRTYRLVVVDDNTWRADIITDTIHPQEVNSFFAVKDHVYYTYGAAGNTFTRRPVQADTVVSITPDLYPGVYSHVHDGIDKGWTTDRSMQAPAASGVVNVPTVTVVKQEATPCGTPAPGTAAPASCIDEQRIDFAANTINSGPTAGKQMPRGGIPVYAEERLNGVIVRQFIAQSLQLTTNVTIAAPTEPPGVVTPISTVNSLPVVTVTGTAVPRNTLPASTPLPSTPKQ